MKVLKNVRIYDFKTYINNGYVVFDKEIHEVGDMKDYQNNKYIEIDGNNQLLMPGLVNGHSHIYSTFGRGISVDFNPTNFKELLEQLWWKLDRYLDNKMTYYSSLVSGILYAKNGVTTIIDHHASGEILGSLEALDKGLNDVGLRRILCFETSDRFNIDHCIKENKDFIDNHTSTFSQGLFGLHAAFTLSDSTLKHVQNKKGNTPIHIHVAESKLDQDDSLSKHGIRVINRLHNFNLINKDSIITHGLYLSDEELQIIKEQEAVIALNVTSNMNNGVGLPHVKKMKEHGINIIIGNDGISQKMTTEYQNLYFSMHLKDQSPTDFTYDDLISIINNTYDYASRRLNVKLGKIQPGYQADFILLNYEEPTPITSQNIFGHLLFGLFNDFKPTSVYIKGTTIVKNHNVSETLMKQYKHAKQSAQSHWDKVEKEGAL